jgi:hypothetical protein
VSRKEYTKLIQEGERMVTKMKKKGKRAGCEKMVVELK